MTLEAMPHWQKNPIKVVSFDLDDTLWPTTSTLNRAFSAYEEWFSEQFPELCPDTAQRWIQEQLPIVRQSPGGHCMTYTRTETLKAFFIEQGYEYEEAEGYAHAGFSAMYAYRNRVNPFEGISDCLLALRKKAHLATLTNGNANVELTELKGHFDANFTPASVGTCKPDRAMFLAITEHFGVSPEEVLHVGDHFEDDVQAALEAGMHALWIVHPHDVAERTTEGRNKMQEWIDQHRQNPIAPVTTGVDTLKHTLLKEVQYAKKDKDKTS